MLSAIESNKDSIIASAPSGVTLIVDRSKISVSGNNHQYDLSVK